MPTLPDGGTASSSDMGVFSFSDKECTLRPAWSQYLEGSSQEHQQVAEKCLNEGGPPERAAHRAEEPPPSDEQLLERFIRRDQAAFAVLLERHGPMVWTVCRRLLQHV